MEVLNDETVDKAIASTGWKREDDELLRVFERDDFAGALVFVNAVGEVAERANHHPDVDIRWNKVTLHLSTHSEGGITEADLALAAAIDELS